MKNKEKNESILSDEKEFADLFYKALQHKKWTIPKTPEEVRIDEESGLEIEFKDLPPHLQNSAEIFRGGPKFTLKVCRIDEENDTSTDSSLLSRAARFGQEISEEVEERMRIDREKALENLE